jgi:CDGSH-type Zn-finger protein
MTQPVVAQKAPYKFNLEAGKQYYWCACGLSKSQPFCDGSHKTTDITPMAFTAAESKEAYLCGCKNAATKPFCDGTHRKL